MDSKMHPQLHQSALYTIGWIAALPLERAAGHMMLDERHVAPSDFSQHPSDHNSYTWGCVAGHNVVIASMPSGRYGTTPAAETVGGLRASLPHIRFGLLVGIGAGIPGKSHRAAVLLGDVIVSNPEGLLAGTVQYDLSKARQLGGNSKYQRIGFLNSPPQAILSALAALRADHETEDPQMWRHLQVFQQNERTKATYGYPGAEKDLLRRTGSENRDTPEIHYGTIASGNTLIKSSAERDELVELLNEEEVEPLCFEMEAAGLMNTFPCLVIRGICDYADEHKNGDWQRYAAAVAAAFAKELLSYVKKESVEREAKLDSILSIGGCLSRLIAGKVSLTRQSTGHQLEYHQDANK